MNYIRIWQACDIEQISKHLIIVGDITADCANCREFGIEYAQARSCPKCGTEFKFIACRSAGGQTMGTAVRRITSRCPNLTFVDYGDYKSLIGKKEARDFFN